MIWDALRIHCDEYHELELFRTPTFWIYPPQTPLKSTKNRTYMMMCQGCMKDLDTKDTYTRMFLNSIKKKLSYCLDTSHECAARLNRKCVKKLKITHSGIWQNLELISHVPLRSLNIPSLKALTEKLSPGIPKMPKSLDQPLCAYLMRYDTHLQSHPRSWPKWYIYHKKWNPMEKQFKLLSRHQTLMTEHPGSLRKASKYKKKTNIAIQRNPGYVSCVPMMSL